MLLRAGAAALLLSFAFSGQARAEDCGRDAFATVVSKAGADLTAMNAANKLRLHEKLQLLKARAGWSDGDYVANATPFVQDETIATFDARHNALIAKVSQLGKPAQAAASMAGLAPSLDSAGSKRCALVEQLQALMGDVVDNTRAKWGYVTGKVDAALQKFPAETAGN